MNWQRDWASTPTRKRDRWHAGIRDRVAEDDRRKAERTELVAAMDDETLPF